MHNPPQQSIVWPGAMLASIAHAIFTCRCPNLSYEQSWDGYNYSVQDSAGSRGTISFVEAGFVAAFFLDESGRNPFRSRVIYSPDDLFAGIPDELRRLAEEETLQYLLEDFDGRSVPLATAAFWGDGSSRLICSADPWDVTLAHGAHLVDRQLLDMESALASWTTEFELHPWEVTLVRKLYDRRAVGKVRSITVDLTDRELLKRSAAGDEGWKECRESLAEVGIAM